MGHILGILLATLGAGLEADHRVLSYGQVPTYYGVIVNWAGPDETVELFDAHAYDGHLDYINRTHGKRFRARGFAKRVSSPKARTYLPFVLYTLPEVAGRRPWVFRLQRYRYQDNDADLAKVAARAAQRVADHLDDLKDAPLIFTYGHRRHRPNLRMRPDIVSAGLTPITLKEILLKVNAPDLTVLNPGTVVGRVVRAQEDGILPNRGARIIALYPSLPDRTPVLAGIVTLEAQTPLSHTNLLAKSRGTVNVHIRTWDRIPGLAKWEGQLVQLTATKDDVTARRIDEAEAEAFWQAQPPLDVALPQPRAQRGPLVRLGQSRRASVRDVGAKAAQYDRLLDMFSRDRVRPAWAVTFRPYLEVVATSGVQPLIDALVKDAAQLSSDELRSRLDDIRKTLLRATVPSDTLDALARLARRRFNDRRIRLRSSTNAEDLAEFNGAGLYRSVGVNIRNEESKEVLKARLQKKIRKVYASLWTERAYLERAHYGIDHRQVAMALLVHRAFRNELADGVAVTQPHSRRQTFDVLVHAQHGGGGVTHAHAGEATEAFVWRHGSGNRVVVQSVAPAGQILLGDGATPRRERRWLLSAMRKVHRRLLGKRRPGFGVDVEFKVMGRGPRIQIFLKQVRPLPTSLPE